MLAGPGVPGDQIIVEQQRLIAEASGVSKEKTAQNAASEAGTANGAGKSASGYVLNAQLHDALAARGVPDAQIGAQIRAITSPWFRYL